MITFPNAKINLGLNIVAKRPDGYHDLETIFYPIPLEDALEVTPLTDHTEPYRLQQNGLAIEGKAEQNLVVRAYLLLKSHYDLPPVDIHLFKHIPSGAGLGGGSADAAFMLKLLNEQFDLHLSTAQLEKFASTLGADCAFFVRNRPTFAKGIGNLFSPISLTLSNYQLVVVKPRVFVSTREAFAHVSPHRPEKSLKDIIQLPVEQWKDCMKNDFEDSVFPQFPVIKEWKDELYRRGAIYASMSGSGSSVYGLFHPDAEIPAIPIDGNDQIFYLKIKD